MIWFEKQYATIWKVEDKGNYSNVRMSTSRKDKKNEDAYLNSNWSFIRFVGKAHEKVTGLGAKTRITINKGGLTKEPYMKEGEKVYPKEPSFVVFDFDLSDSPQQKEEEDFQQPDESDMPF